MEPTTDLLGTYLTALCEGKKAPRLVALGDGLTFNTETGECRYGDASANFFTIAEAFYLKIGHEWKHSLKTLRLIPVTPGHMPRTVTILSEWDGMLLVEKGIANTTYALLLTSSGIVAYTVHEDDATELHRIKLKQELRLALVRLGSISLAEDPMLFDGDYKERLNAILSLAEDKSVATLLDSLSKLKASAPSVDISHLD